MSLPLGKADWMYDAEWDMHIPGCSQPKGRWRCGNGPLTGDQILSGDCGEDHNSHIVTVSQADRDMARVTSFKCQCPRCAP